MNTAQALNPGLNPTTLYWIAGEASGDRLGAHLAQAIARLSPTPLNFRGVAGPRMEAAGITSIFPMQSISLMGFFEVLPHLFSLRRRLQQTVEDILATRPAMVITIDSPGFTFRVVKALRARGYRGQCIHYVAPSVWAYKPERAAKMQRFFDAVLALLPFEKPYFDKAGLACYFVGHPAIAEAAPLPPASLFREQHHIAAEIPLLCLLPGSRPGEIARHMPLFLETVRRLLPDMPGLATVLPTTPTITPLLAEWQKHWPCPLYLTTTDEARDAALAASNLALVKSGTISLEVARAGVPMVVTYRVNPLSAWLLRRMIRVPYVTLVNLLANAPIIPELLQERATPEALSAALGALWRDPAAQHAQRSQAQAALAQLIPPGGETPSERAARYILARLGHTPTS